MVLEEFLEYADQNFFYNRHDVEVNVGKLYA